ncbi:MAG: ribonuclease P protein component [Clostridia bacterium]|nr:ribonuclease P protein component [Clostridia bacterium]
MTGIVTLKQNTEFRHTYGRGKSCVSPLLVTYAVRSKQPYCRIGITTSKKLGNAVERNRCRRIIRAAFSVVMSECDNGWDLVFVARFRTKQVKAQDIAAVMRNQLSQLGVITEE